MFTNSPILGNSFTGMIFFLPGRVSLPGKDSFQEREGLPAREINVSLSGKAFLHRKVRNTISDNMRGSQNRETLPWRAQNGKLFPDGISTYSEKYSPLKVGGEVPYLLQV